MCDTYDYDVNTETFFKTVILLDFPLIKNVVKEVHETIYSSIFV